MFFHSWNDIDPTVLIDDDGQAYLYWGNPECYWVKLNSDMISFNGKIDSLVPRMKTYQEGPWIYKKDNKYYLSWSSTCCPEGIGYAVADKPTGPWTYKNSIMDGNSNSSGNQPGIFDFKGSTYTTGFTNELWYSIQGGRTTRYERRSASLAKLSFDADGTIPKIPWFGAGNPVPGVPQVGSLNPYDTVQAETICFSKGVRTEVCKDVSGKMDVDSIHNGDYIKVKGVDFKSSGQKLFEARVASGANGGTIEIYIDSINGTKIGSCAFQGTSGWQTWATKSCVISNVSGKHDLFFKFTGGSGLLFNFNWWKFTESTGTGTMTGNIIYSDKVKLSVEKSSHTVNLDFVHFVSYQNINVELFDAKGRLVRSTINNAINSGRIALHLNKNEIHAGIYLIRVLQNNKTVFTQQFDLQ
jgi:arabinoxylan arabinofuranohydrolase